MKSAALHLHSLTDGTYRLVVTLWEDGQGSRVLLQEESHPMPEVPMSAAWTVAAQMAQDALSALEPAPGLWQAASWNHTG